MRTPLPRLYNATDTFAYEWFNTPASFSGGLRFDCSKGGLYRLRMSLVFLIPSRKILECYLKIGHDRFLSYPSKVTSHSRYIITCENEDSS
jgi:hypothetical protein